MPTGPHVPRESVNAAELEFYRLLAELGIPLPRDVAETVVRRLLAAAAPGFWRKAAATAAKCETIPPDDMLRAAVYAFPEHGDDDWRKAAHHIALLLRDFETQ